MAIRLSTALIARMTANIDTKVTSESLAHELIERTQNDLVKVRIPGAVAATFKRPTDVGKTFKSLYGGFSAEHILDTHAERISVGEYTCRAKASEELRVSAAGQVSLGGIALESMMMASLESNDVQCQNWVAKCLEAPAVDTPAPQPTPEVTPAKPKKERKPKATVGELVGKTV